MTVATIAKPVLTYEKVKSWFNLDKLSDQGLAMTLESVLEQGERDGDLNVAFHVLTCYRIAALRQTLIDIEENETACRAAFNPEYFVHVFETARAGKTTGWLGHVKSVVANLVAKYAKWDLTIDPYVSHAMFKLRKDNGEIAELDRVMGLADDLLFLLDPAKPFGVCGNRDCGATLQNADHRFCTKACHDKIVPPKKEIPLPVGAVPFLPKKSKGASIATSVKVTLTKDTNNVFVIADPSDAVMHLHAIVNAMNVVQESAVRFGTNGIIVKNDALLAKMAGRVEIGTFTFVVTGNQITAIKELVPV